ncbi:MAG: sugar phosphate isomerase/epimerase [Eubacteriales bacterium]|nr:sugar phosphate isomerase/epimerase [Eubacteriales bacterium]
MRLGAPVFIDHTNPEAYALAHVQKGYRAAYCPEGLRLEDTTAVAAYRDALARHDIVLAEVGAWCNPLAADKETAEKNVQYIAQRLALADELGAVACVNIVGSSCTDNWYGPAPDNYTPEFFDRAVDAARRVIDLVRPRRTKMAFEMVPYNFIDSPQQALRFIEAVDRPAAGIHVDLTNCITSPRLYYANAQLIRSAFALLGGNILSIHCKDILLHNDAMTVVLEEVPIGQGNMDYVTLLQLGNQLQPDTPFMLEHLPDEAAYDQSAAGIRRYARQAGVAFL